MRVLIVGGTGLISVGIVSHLLRRGAQVAMFNRGERERTVPAEVEHIKGDRNDAGFARIFESKRFDVVIDMICFTPAHAEASIQAFGGRCEQFIFCSTVCTYGVKVPPLVLIDERFPQEPISQYGRDKVACEKYFRTAHDARRFQLTIVRPSHTYGEGHPLIDQLEFDARSWDRMERGRPVLLADEGLGLWQSTHRDDCGSLFAHACLNKRTYGEDYNATRDEILTWHDYYAEVARTLGVHAQLLSLPSREIIAADPQRFGLLREITRFHGAYTSAKAKRDIPGFHCSITLHEGARRIFAASRKAGTWKDSRDDRVYDQLVDKALAESRMGASQH